MTAQELERLILHKCHQHTHIHMHSPEFADMYMSRVIHMHLSSNPDLLCVHTVKGIHGAHKHFHRETWIFMKHTGYMQHPPAVLLSVFLRHSKIWPTLCVLAPLYHVWSKRATGWLGQPVENITATRESPTSLPPAETPCWNSPHFTFLEVHQFIAHTAFPWSSAVCRQVLRLPAPKTKPAKSQAGWSQVAAKHM